MFQLFAVINANFDFAKELQLQFLVLIMQNTSHYGNMNLIPTVILKISNPDFGWFRFWEILGHSNNYF